VREGRENQQRVPDGLTSEEAAARLKQFGPHILPVRAATPAWRQLMAQLVHFFALMLWIAGVLAILAEMPQLGLAIFLVIIINGSFAFFQEHRAERASQKLRDLLPRRAMVLRDDAPLEIDASAGTGGYYFASGRRSHLCGHASASKRGAVY
jgi:magnesium-transporting ATPase (P-type)